MSIYQSHVNHWPIDASNCVVSLLNLGSQISGHAAIVVERLLKASEGDEKERLYVAHIDISAIGAPSETIYETFQNVLGNTQGYIDEIRIFDDKPYSYEAIKEKSYSTYSSKSWYASPDEVEKMMSSIRADIAKNEPVAVRVRPIKNDLEACAELAKACIERKNRVNIAGINKESRKIKKALQLIMNEREDFNGIRTAIAENSEDVSLEGLHVLLLPILLEKIIRLHSEYLVEIKNFPFKYQKAGNKRSWWLGGNKGHNCVTWAEDHLNKALSGNGKMKTDKIKAVPQIHTSLSNESLYSITAVTAAIGAYSLKTKI